jgi:hypothetical protein
MIEQKPWLSLPREIVPPLRAGVPSTADEIIATIRRAVPAYRRPLEGAFGQAMRAGVERSLTDFLDEVEGVKRDTAEEERDIYIELGRGEAREGRTIESLLAAYRLGARVAWRNSAEAIRAAGFDSDTLILLAEAFFAYIDQLSASSAQGYAEEQSAIAGEAVRNRRRLLGMLVQTPPVDRAAIEGAAREAEWELPAALAALVWRDESERPVAPRLPLGALAAPIGDDLICALVADPDAPGRRAELEAALGGRRAALGPTVPWSEAWLSAARARATQRLIADGVVDDGPLAQAERHLADLILHGDPALVRELARARLAPLDERPARSRERLLETLAAWLDRQGNVAQVAEQLHVHPQTVRYRLGQLRELFGDDLEDPRARFELSLAVRA